MLCRTMDRRATLSLAALSAGVLLLPGCIVRTGPRRRRRPPRKRKRRPPPKKNNKKKRPPPNGIVEVPLEVLPDDLIVGDLLVLDGRPGEDLLVDEITPEGVFVIDSVGERRWMPARFAPA